ncbi:LysR family transcriptional regulator [Aquabacterium sp. A7-Y]|uniref:LysR family transcriptional regulator n=1 Tax=Aquabacterium sp. A7-Y TaxID=1349605 RepID=UPI00223D9695|nr:LysR family transcriptional regulator [Aquabacterium sp. A7-Y]MCW7538325.1 LysR family transcriptional regulator [Aquabacterium sp. A7-Y]
MNFRTLDLNLLRVFDQVMAEQNLTRAAERLAMTQPAVSNALRRLREAMGDDLVVRTAFGVKPTPRAEALWPEVRAALARLRDALDPADFDPGASEATFRLAMADATAATLLPPLVERIEKTQALTNVRVFPLTTRDPRGLLDKGEVDFAIGYFPDAVAALTSQGSAALLHHERLWDGEYVCVMRKGHPLASQPLTLDNFCSAHHLLVSFSGRAHGFVDQALAILKRTRRIVLTVNQFFTAGRVVMHSDLLTVLPRDFLPATGFEHELTQKPLPLALQGVHVEVLWHQRHDSDPAHRWMREQILAVGALRGARRSAPGASSAPGED